MITLTIRSVLMDSDIQGLYQLFLFKNGGYRGTKKEFLEYMKHQVTEFGNGDYLLSSAEYEELTMADLDQLMKWKLL